jgi:hypothetical protein
MGANAHDVIATLLVSVFWFVLIVGTILAFLVANWRGRHPAVKVAQVVPDDAPSVIRLPNLCPTGLKRPNCWLAVKNKNVAAVQSALSIHNPKPCSWAEGLSGNAEQKVFISPRVSGWILVVGSALPDPGEDVDACFRFLLDLSRKLGHVQFFNANTVLNHHAWVQVESGRVLRAYAWAGKTLWNQGKITQPEADLGMKCYGYTEAADPPNFSANLIEPGVNNSDKVHFLAARWSIDPEDIDHRFTEQGLGIVGEPSKHF